MEKTLNINGKNIKFKCTGGFLINFRALTGKDPIKSISLLSDILDKSQKKNTEAIDNNFDINDLSIEDLQTFYEIVWILAKTADKEIPDLNEWLNDFDEFPIADIITDLLDLIQQAFKSNLSLREPKKKQVQKKLESKT